MGQILSALGRNFEPVNGIDEVSLEDLKVPSLQAWEDLSQFEFPNPRGKEPEPELVVLWVDVATVCSGLIKVM